METKERKHVLLTKFLFTLLACSVFEAVSQHPFCSCYLKQNPASIDDGKEEHCCTTNTIHAPFQKIF